MTVIGEAFVAVRPDASNFGPETERSVLGSVTKIAKTAATIFGGAFAVKKGFDFLSDSVGEARESNKVAAQTAQAIKSTGGAAKVTTADVDKLANSISRKTGIDDEQIATSENLLLTFTNIRNETGKGRDIFNQATQAVADMSAVQGDLAGNSILVGKALQDPVAGVTALQRVGVKLTAQQKDQIKHFVAVGDAASAQKVILGELATEFGGQAAAQATAADRLKVTIGNVKERVGGVLIPIIDRVANFVADKLPGAIDALGRVAGRVGRVLEPLIGAAKQVFDVLFRRDFTGGPFAEDSPFIDTVFKVRDAVTGFFNTLRTGFTEDEGTPFERIALTIRKDVLPVFRTVAEFVKDHLKPILIGVGIALALAVAPVTTVVAALTFLYLRFQVVRDIVAKVIEVVRGFVGFLDRDVRPIVERVAATIAEGFGKVVESVSKRLAPLAETVGHIIKAVEVVIAIALAPILLVWKIWGDQIKQIVGVVFGTIKVVVEQALRVIGDVIDFVLALINGDWGKAWHALEDIPKAVFSAIRAEVEGGIRIIATIIGSLPGKLTALGGLLVDAGASLGGALLRGLGKGISGAVGFVEDIGKAVLKAIKDFINHQVIDRVNRALEIKIKGPGFLPDISLNPPDIPHLAAGAIVTPKPGGVIARIAEAGRREAVLPLPDGLLEGLQALARMARTGGLGRSLSVTLVAPPERNAGREVIAELRAAEHLGMIA